MFMAHLLDHLAGIEAWCSDGARTAAGSLYPAAQALIVGRI
jgi:hypothetical protein